MAPTQVSLIVLLGMLMLFHAAHADESAENLYNEEALTQLSVVRNWTLICEQLCSLNLSGPACGLDCQPAEIPVEKIQQTTEAETREEYNFPAEHQSELCETLCDNGLGGNRCTCLVKILPAAASFHPFPQPLDRNRICSNFCRFHSFTLRGCSQCPFEGIYRPPLRYHGGFPQVSPQVLVYKENNAVSSPDDQKLNQGAFSNQDVTDPPTPDWNRVCIQLCRQGNGGILCNCDLAPF